MHAIFDVVYNLKEMYEQNRQNLKKVIEEMQVETVVLACSELPILLSQTDIPSVLLINTI